jgi:hypothetical protein
MASFRYLAALATPPPSGTDYIGAPETVLTLVERGEFSVAVADQTPIVQPAVSHFQTELPGSQWSFVDIERKVERKVWKLFCVLPISG